MGSEDSTLAAGSLWDGQVIEGDELPKVTAPFHVDSTLCPTRQAAESWFVAFTLGSMLKKKKNESLAPIPGTTTLRDLSGSDHLMLMRIRHLRAAKVNTGLKLVGFYRESVIGLDVSIIDARNGELLWQDRQFLPFKNDPPIKDGDIAWFVKQVVKSMP